MNTRPSARIVIGVLMVLTAVTLGNLGVPTSALPIPNHGHDISQALSDFADSAGATGVETQAVRVSRVTSFRGPHGYEHRVNPARFRGSRPQSNCPTNSRAGGRGSCVRTVAVRPGDCC